jgi:hypothetical protein
VVPFRYGIEVPVNFSVTPTLHSGLRGLQFGTDTFLLIVERMPGGIEPQMTGKLGYMVIQVASPSDDKQEMTRALREHLGTIRLQLLTTVAEDAVACAANDAAGDEVFRHLLNGTLTAQVPLNARGTFPAPVEPKEEVPAVPAPALPWYDDNSTSPPPVQLAREVGSAFAGLFTDRISRAVWASMTVDVGSFFGRPALVLSDDVFLVYAACAPSKHISHLPAGEDYRPEQPAIALVQRVLDPRQLAAAAAFPLIDFARWSLVSFHSGWRPAVTAGVSRCIVREKEQCLRKSLSDKPEGDANS